MSNRGIIAIDTVVYVDRNYSHCIMYRLELFVCLSDCLSFSLSLSLCLSLSISLSISVSIAFSLSVSLCHPLSSSGPSLSLCPSLCIFLLTISFTRCLPTISVISSLKLLWWRIYLAVQLFPFFVRGNNCSSSFKIDNSTFS